MQEEKMLRQLILNFTSDKTTKIKLVMSLKYTPVTQSILGLISLMCVAIMHIKNNRKEIKNNLQFMNQTHL